MMMLRGLPITIGLVVAAGAFWSPASAGVVVLTNRAEGKVALTIIQPDGRQTRHGLDRGEVLPVPVAAAVTIVFNAGGEPRRRLLQANGIYYFHTDGNKLDLVQHPLPGLPADRPMPKPPSRPRDDLCTIPVKILVDDKEPTVRRVWEKRYRERMAEASEIIERHCRVRFQVVSVGAWTSNDGARELRQLFEEFERKVNPAPARLAIGFTGQYQTLREEKRMGGTRGPFHSHILIREWGRQVAEPERLEMLVHELGHFLGAVHSPEHQSVMRPDVGDRQSRARAFRIGFDAPNTLVLFLVGEELRSRTRPLMHLCQLPSAAKDHLRAVYRSLAAAMPGDSAAPKYLAMIDQSLGLAGEPPERRQAVIAGARTVVRAVTEAAQKNRQLPEKLPSPIEGGTGGEGILDPERQVRLDGDELTEHYVRQAAAAARRLPREVAGAAFLLGLGVALDDSPLPDQSGTGPFFGGETPFADRRWAEDMDLSPSVAQLESASERAARLAVLGAPTMHARRDLLRHFAVSAALVVLVGPRGAEGAGILKELADARGGSGFSFADLSADLAGVVFAVAVGKGKIPLSRLEDSFSVGDFLPEVGGLKEGIGWNEFVGSYGYPPDARLSRQRAPLLKRILALPGYK
ncbi:MAG: hypothetical protein KKE86_15730 [Planctomycetes bacterium]|nr:hypothetical protein [Planctomycetota bacterium]